MSDDKSIKIGGVENSELLGEDKDHRIIDLYEVGQALLFYMTKGQHTPPREKAALMKTQFEGFDIQGTNKEVLDLLQKLNVVPPVPKPRSTPSTKKLCNHVAFWPAIKRLGYFQDISSYLDETKPRPERLRNAIVSLTVVPRGNNRSNWSSMFKEGVIEAMVKLHEKSGKPKEAQQDPKQAKQDPKHAESSKQNPPHETTNKVNYNYTRPVSLIRFMRNGFTHIQTFSSRKTVGERTLVDDLKSNASEFEETFRTLFPDLFVSVYVEVEKHFDDLLGLLKKHYQA